MILGKTLLLVLVIAVSVVTVAGLGQKAANSNYRPSEVKLNRATWRNFGSYRRQRPGEQFMVGGFFPIGWSKDGKFAYYFEPVDEACDCYFANFYIIDLKSDKILWSFDYDGSFAEDPKKEGKPQDLNSLWRANARLFSEKLKEHAIEAQRRFTLLSFPLLHQGDRLTAQLTTKEKPGLKEEERLYGVVDKATLQLTSRRNGTKTILDQSFGDLRPLYVGMIGYLKSAFEPRIAVVLIEVYRGYEGPPHVGEVKIVGASLNTGFE